MLEKLVGKVTEEAKVILVLKWKNGEDNMPYGKRKGYKKKKDDEKSKKRRKRKR